ncbi:hypothetical protein CSC17_0068 [Klebsiella oxytoca]|nr:hypothetical protein CSC17_0068 [Klebsiella oxytoca]
MIQIIVIAFPFLFLRNRNSLTPEDILSLIRVRMEKYTA